MQITECRLQITDYRLQSTGERLRVRGERLRVRGERGGLFPGPSVLQTGRFYPPPPSLRSSSPCLRGTVEYRVQSTDERLQVRGEG